MESRGPGSIDEKNLLANYQAALFSHHANGQPAGIAAMMTAAAAAGGYPTGNPSPGPNSNQQPSQQQQQISMLNQAQYMATILQQNDTFNVIQNTLASGVPTLDVPTIFSYLGYTNTFQPQNNNNNNNPFNNNGQNSVSGSLTSNNGLKSSKNNLEVKYGKLMDVIQEIGRDVRPLYTGSKTASDRLRRQINQARHLVRECLMEVDRRAQRSTNN